MAPSSSITSACYSRNAVRIMESSFIDTTTTTPHSYSLPLTFFDIPWLQYPQLQPLFFFQLTPEPEPEPEPEPISFSEFSSSILPTLKHSLSSALQYFSAFAAKLTTISHHNNNNLFFLTENGKDSSVGLTVASCNADFDQLSSYLNKSALIFQQLVPSLPTIASSSTVPVPLLAIQITFFPSPSPGFSIGFASHPVLCDQRTFCNFLQTWASFSKFRHLNFSLPPTSFDRSVILDSDGLLRSILLNQWLGLESSPSVSIKPPGAAHVSLRSTFVMGSTDIANATRWLQSQCDTHNRPHPILLSPYVVTCAFLWTCFLKARVNNSAVTKAKSKGPMYFGFIAGAITRLPYRVPDTYFGNCVGFGRAVAMREELLKEKGQGMLAAADAIGLTIKMLDNNVLGGAEKWISEWQTLITDSEDHIHVVGSPKVSLYETDFGWGKPKKIEEVSIDGTRAISLTQSRDMKGGIEIGITLSNSIMDDFYTIFTQGLRDFAH